MESIVTKHKEDNMLVTTIHNQESVVEVYLNGKDETVTELRHLSNNRAGVYQYTLNDYLIQNQGFKNIDKKIAKLLSMN